MEPLPLDKPSINICNEVPGVAKSFALSKSLGGLLLGIQTRGVAASLVAVLAIYESLSRDTPCGGNHANYGW